MNTSPKSPSRPRNTALEAQRTALRRLFWERQVIDQMRLTESATYRLEIPHVMSAQELLHLVFGDGPVEKGTTDTVTFMLTTVRVGDELWGAIAAGLNYDPPLRIVEPFPMPDQTISGIPLFKEEL